MQAVRSKTTVPLVQSARRALLLSGTPALNRPSELLPQVCRMICGKMFAACDTDGQNMR